MNSEKRKHFQEMVSDLDRRIEKLKTLMGGSVAQGSREFWSAQIETLEEQRNDFQATLGEELVEESPDLQRK